ncbi:MAG: hypothetical protein RL308_911 [Bacteroidota bacterium]|jgi:threonyl-tRNA synthetase
MKKENRLYWILILLLATGTTNAQNTSSDIHKIVDSINAILKANSLAYYTDNQQNSAFIKKTSANEQGIITFTDSIPKSESTTNNAKQKLQPDCCPPKRIRTLDLLAVKKWEIYFPNAYLKDKNNQTFGRIVGLRKEDLYKLKEKLDQLTTLCIRETKKKL